MDTAPVRFPATISPEVSTAVTFTSGGFITFPAIFWLFNDIIQFATVTVLSFAVLANMINILVFFKDGFTATSNISFFVLAIVDLLVSAINIPLVLDMASDFVIQVAPCGEALNTIGSWVTVIITMERLCCVAFPLKVIFHGKPTKCLTNASASV